MFLNCLVYYIREFIWQSSFVVKITPTLSSEHLIIRSYLPLKPTMLPLTEAYKNVILCGISMNSLVGVISTHMDIEVFLQRLNQLKTLKIQNKALENFVYLQITML